MTAKETAKAMSILSTAHEFALHASGCTKVAVASVIVLGEHKVYGANRSIPNLCKTQGCLRVKLYGDCSKEHRGPGDCRAIHSEVDAICRAANLNTPVRNGTIYVTRYPCEACARAIVSAGIRRVYYGREQEITEETKRIFKSANIEVVWVRDWKEQDVTT